MIAAAEDHLGAALQALGDVLVDVLVGAVVVARHDGHVAAIDRPEEGDQVDVVLEHVGEVLGRGLAQALGAGGGAGAHHLSLVPGHAEESRSWRPWRGWRGGPAGNRERPGRSRGPSTSGCRCAAWANRCGRRRPSAAAGPDADGARTPKPVGPAGRCHSWRSLLGVRPRCCREVQLDRGDLHFAAGHQIRRRPAAVRTAEAVAGAVAAWWSRSAGSGG